MIVGSAPETAVARILARARSPSSEPVFSLPTTTSEAPSTMPEELPGSVDVLDLLDPVVLLQRDRVEAAHLADRGERRLQAAERLDGGAGTDELVVVQDDLVVDVEHRDDRVGKAAVGLRGGGALLRADGVGVDVVAAEVLDGGDEVGADPLGHERGVIGGLGVHRPGAAVRAHGNAAHRLHAAGEHEVLPAGGDLLGGDVDGLQARGAEAVELDAGDGVGQPGLDGGRLGDVGALVADRRHAAEHDVVDAGGVELGVAAERLMHEADDQVHGLGGVQRPVDLALSPRRADGVEDERFGSGHGSAP
jgi:hypothetical protein